MVTNAWESLGIASLEYCRIERSASLLRCTVEDILHWAEIGNIELCIKVHDVKCNMVFPIVDLYKRLEFLISWLGSNDSNDYLKNNNPLFSMSNLVDVYPGICLSDGLDALVSMIAECQGVEAEIDGVWALEQRFFKNYEIKSPPVIGDGCDEDCGLTVRFLDAIEYDFHDGIRKLLMKTSFILTSPDSDNKKYVAKAMVSELVNPVVLSVENLYITKKQIEKIYHASLNGMWALGTDKVESDYNYELIRDLSVGVLSVTEQRKILIMDIIQSQGYSPLELPYKNGVLGVKNKIRELAMIKDRRMTVSSFNNAWKELLSERRIANLSR